MKQVTFAALCDEVIRQPVPLTVTREGLHSLPEEEQNRVKRVRYLTASTFRSSPSPRTKAHVGPCNLIFLDVDDRADALRLLDSHWPTMLQGLPHLVYHTARSTKTYPRLRIVVSAEGIPAEQYPLAVEKIASLVGVSVTRESLVPVQPMFLPVTFQHESVDPVHTYEPAGKPFDVDWLREPEAPADVPLPHQPPASSDVIDLMHLRAPIEGVTPDDAAGALEHLDPDCSMMAWIEVGAALKHQFAEAGFDLWHAWSEKGRKYTNEKDTRYRWDSLKGQTKDRAPVTIRSLFRAARARGWINDRLAKKAFADTTAWLSDPARSTEELFDHGVERIARVTPMVGEMERGVLIQSLHTRLKARGMKCSIAEIRREVTKMEVETERQTQGLPPWVAGLVFVTSGGYFYQYTVGRSYSPEVMDLMRSAPSFDKKPVRTSSYLIKDAGIPVVENLRYEPQRAEERIFTAEGVPYINTYRQTYVKADPKGRAEAGKIIEEHFANLILQQEFQTTYLDWWTYLVQYPGQKIRWAPLIQSTKGAGKGWCADMGDAILGPSNVMKLGPSTLMKANFNDWAYGQQLLVMEEVRVVGHNRYEVMDKLKPCISDTRLSLDEKYERVRTVPNVTNYLLFTNHHDALAIQDDERRYFVLQSPLQTAADIEKLGPDYFDRLYHQIKHNAGGLRSYFEQRKISASFRPDGRAPVTPYLQELAMAAATPLAQAVMNALKDGDHPLIRPDLVSVKTLRLAIETNDGLGRFHDQAVGAVLKDMGWSRGPRCRLENERHQLWVKGVAPEAAARVASERLEVL